MMWFENILLVIACLSIWHIIKLATGSSCPEEEEPVITDSKRLLLHSESDVASEFLALRSELDELRGRLTNVTAQNTVLQSKMTNLKQMVSTATQATASVYVRWGRNVCPADTEFVYHGFTAGKHYSSKGGGSDTICLASDPTWDQYDSAQNYLRATVYGAEIDIEVPSNTFAQNPNQQDMPCAICRSPRPTSLMTPGRKDCYPGWTREYWGFLVAAWEAVLTEYNHICMDANPEYMQHGGTNDDEHIIYLVEARCGSLPCPPYVDGREITCVVCSK